MSKLYKTFKNINIFLDLIVHNARIVVKASNKLFCIKPSFELESSSSVMVSGALFLNWMLSDDDGSIIIIILTET